eukprot:TRINITY_DN13692_c0_g1_i1.p1 TRINITY_DN13692_c0_g1~~TRINITY_DN13692_c0_g1_i1.p1  ORF type:complete len:231 (-),score=14.70 TRINITY_DN13692_c0_g1_i1:32-724(-)
MRSRFWCFFGAAIFLSASRKRSYCMGPAQIFTLGSLVLPHRIKLPPEVVSRVKEQTQISDAEMREIAASFSVHARFGKITKEMMYHVFEENGIKDIHVMDGFFHLLDKDGDGQVSLPEFLLTLGLLRAPKNPQAKCRAMFQVMDLESRGRITEDDLRLLIRTLLSVGEKLSPEGTKHRLYHIYQQYPFLKDVDLNACYIIMANIEAKHIFAVADLDYDGILSYQVRVYFA